MSIAKKTRISRLTREEFTADKIRTMARRGCSVETIVRTLGCPAADVAKWIKMTRPAADMAPKPPRAVPQARGELNPHSDTQDVETL